MVLKKRRVSNTNTDSNINTISVNNATSVKIADACPSETNCRIFFSVTNNSDADIWIKLQAASVGDDKKGIMLYPCCYWEMPPDEKYIGEISAIADDINGEIVVTEY